MASITLLLRYEIIADALNYDARMRRVHWTLALAHPNPTSADGLSHASGVAISTVKDKMRYMRRQGVVELRPGGWVFTEVGYKWFHEFHQEMMRVAKGGVRFSPELLMQISTIADAKQIDFEFLEVTVFRPLIEKNNVISVE